MGKIKNIFNSLEINKTTKDIEIDIKHLNIKHKIKYYAFYFGIGFLGLSTYFSITNDIKNDDFKKALIEKNHISPIAAYFYSSYKDESQELQTLLNKKIAELRDLENSKASQSSKNQYSYNDFINDLANEKIKINLDEKIKSLKIYQEYLANYFVAQFIQNKDKTVEINGNAYSYIEIGKRVSGLDENEALEKLELPSKLILKELNLDSENKDYIKAVSNALKIIPSYRWREKEFYENLTNLDINKAVEDIKQKIYQHNEAFNFVNNLNNGFKVEIDKLEEDFKAAAEIEKAEQEKRIKEYESNKLEVENKITSIKKDIELIQTTMKDIFSLQNDLSKYDSLKNKIDDNLDKVGL